MAAPEIRPIKKLLVANRGEIAIRVMRTCRDMGIATVAVYSDADRTAPHVRYAEEAYRLGPPPSSQSYLLGDKIIEAAKLLGADAIHPGYGFLSENADFSRKVEEAGLLFVGPGPKAIELMGDKLTSKRTVEANGVPLVPGMATAIDDIEFAKAKAAEIGYPIMIKASAGGGGKGMRRVDDPKDFEPEMKRAMSEAQASFGNASVFIEKFVTSPKHIEVQVLGDKHGNVVHLFERECSIQRRNQKVVEEAPSAALTPELREAIGKTAVEVAKACDYVGAGTVEFMADHDLNYYFLEMNTRLQVEHPVTELVTGVDLVKEMIRIAEGHPISFKQEDLELKGHAIEIRVTAEDPANGFLPDTGTLQTYRPPKGVGVRIDDGYEEGMPIPIYYDSLLAKLICYGADRTEAIERTLRAIEEYRITGIQTVLPFARFALKHPAFVDGSFDTKFVENFFTPEALAEAKSEEEAEIVAALAVQLYDKHAKAASAQPNGHHQKEPRSRWKERARN